MTYPIMYQMYEFKLVHEAKCLASNKLLDFPDGHDEKCRAPLMDRPRTATVRVHSSSSHSVCVFPADSYSLVAPYSDFFALLQLVAIFEPRVGGEGAPRGLAFNHELASLVHRYRILHRF